MGDMSPSHTIPLCAKDDIYVTQKHLFLCATSDLCSAKNYHFEFRRDTALKFGGIFHDITGSQSKIDLFYIQKVFSKIRSLYSVFG